MIDPKDPKELGRLSAQAQILLMKHFENDALLAACMACGELIASSGTNVDSALALIETTARARRAQLRFQ
jgi:hypothetical protein